MKKLLLAAMGTAAAITAAAPAQSAVLLPGARDIAFTDFTPFIGTQGTLLESFQQTGMSSNGPFSGTMRSAVYRTAAGTLDFYYQVVSVAGNPIDRFTVASFGTTLTDAFYYDLDSDAGGIFTAANNDVVMDGNDNTLLDDELTGIQSSGQRSADGDVLRVVFSVPDGAPAGATDDPVGIDPVTGLRETSSTYIFRTNARSYGFGTASIQDGQAFDVISLAPVPEPSTWAMMLVGFGAVGYSMRRRPKYRLVQAV